ncbi:MAG: hypothetical protein JST54_02505 [Deltaproteobacteria bacterium]|nr:hypothetical protein [Deltaproteobacteria bacterium]
MLVTMILACLGCAHAPDSQPNPIAGRPVYPLASLQRSGCFGSCPVYTVVIRSDGTVDWDGVAFVDVKGHATRTLTASDLAVLRAAFDEAGYFELNENYACFEATDNPTATVTFGDGRREKQIRHYYGCRSAKGLDVITRLESRIDEIAKTSLWIGDAPRLGKQ